jgi:outer membrane usher protein
VGFSLLTGYVKPAFSADEILLLEVVINGYDTANIGRFELHNGNLLARPDELEKIGLRVPASAPKNPDGTIDLTGIPGLEAHLHQASQTLDISASNQLLLPQILNAMPGSGRNNKVESGLGTTVNYDIVGSFTGKADVGTGQFDIRGFSPMGVLSSGLLTYAGDGPQGPGSYSVIRLDTTYTYSDPAELLRYRLGDSINGSLTWTRSVRFGGIQIQSDFSMRPDLITFPLPTIGGSVAVPSTLDILVNNTQLFSHEVQPGPFQVPQLPIITGANNVTVTVVNALGRQVSTTIPFYASSDMLAPGLQTYSIELGAVRRNWGYLSNDYGSLAGSGTYRRGVTNYLTIETHLEGTAHLAMGGAGVVINVLNLGAINISAAASSASGHAGRQLSVGAQRIGRILNLGFSMTFADSDFRDIAAMNGQPVPWRQINANAGLSLGRYGSIGVAYAGLDQSAAHQPFFFYMPATGAILSGQQEINGGYAMLPPEHTHLVSASYSLQVGKAALYASGYHDFANNHDNGFLVGLTIPLGQRSSASLSGGESSGTGYEQIQAVQSPVSIGDWGYQAYVTPSNPSHEFAQLQYKSPWGLFSGGLDRTAQQTTGQAEIQGALSLVDGSLFASNKITDSFAVVDTNGIGNIRVFDENRIVGKTDSSGKILVPDLRSFDINHISIDPDDVPMDATLPYTKLDVRPQDRSGVLAKFPIHMSHGALIRFVDGSGNPTPVNSSATLQATGVTVPVGYDGDAYIEGLGSHNRVMIQLPNGHTCIAIFDYKSVPGTIPAIGPIPCLESTH